MGMIQALTECRAYYEHIQDDGSIPSISTTRFSAITLAIEYKDTARVIELFLCCHSNMVNLNIQVTETMGKSLAFLF